MHTVLNTSGLLLDAVAGTSVDILLNAECTVVHRIYHPKRTTAELLEVIEEVRPQGIIAALDPFDAEVIAAGAAAGLRVIARTGVGYDTIDVEAATAHGVTVCTTPGTNEQSVADLTFALLLALARRVPYHDQMVREGQVWTRKFGPELWEKTIGIVGLGAIGRGVARRAAGFGMRVLAHDVVEDAAYARGAGIEYVGLDDLLRGSDVVTLHVSLNASSRNLIGARELSLMKRSALLINTSRGGAIDETALYEALANGTIAGAGLDVFQREPPVGSPLLGLENVVFTAHVAGLTNESIARMVRMAAQNVANVLTGQAPLYAVNEVRGA